VVILIGDDINLFRREKFKSIINALPSSLIDPLEGLTMWRCGRSWNLGPFPISSTKGGGKRGVLEVPGLD
jgi:hypothetical protein